MQIIGQITSVVYKSNSGHEKKVVTLETADDQKLFVEFRGEGGINRVNLHKEGDTVAINIRFEGKISKLSQQMYNNLVGVSIEAATPIQAEMNVSYEQ